MARRTLNFSMPPERQIGGNNFREFYLAVARRQRAIIAESDGMIVREVFGEIAGTRRNRSSRHDDRFRARARSDQTDGHGAVMTTQAHLARSAWLVNPCVGRRAFVDAIIHVPRMPVPKRALSRGVVRGMTEDAHAILADRVNRPRPQGTQIVWGTDHAVLSVSR